jgi:hypothetical protein
MSDRNTLHGIVAAGIAAAVAAGAGASPLSDADLFFDPATFVGGFHPVHGRSAGGSIDFFAQPGRTLVGANILPILEDNFYYPGYVYTQNDYTVKPNQPGGYYASMTGGAVSALFESSGIYTVRLNYSDGGSDYHSVFVDAGFGGGNDPIAGAEAPVWVAPWREVPGKQADLYIVSTGANNDGFINAALQNLGAGPNVAQASTVQAVRDAIQARSAALGGRKIRVAIIGHGYQGSIRLGHGPNAERINNDGAPSSTSGTDFANMIKDWTESVNLFGCNTGGGADGGALLQDIQNAGIDARAYTSTVGMTATRWAAYNWGTKVPAPGAVALAGCAGVLLARRRRG